VKTIHYIYIRDHSIIYSEKTLVCFKGSTCWFDWLTFCRCSYT